MGLETSEEADSEHRHLASMAPELGIDCGWLHGFACKSLLWLHQRDRRKTRE